jgi:hypothetical protein
MDELNCQLFEFEGFPQLSANLEKKCPIHSIKQNNIKRHIFIVVTAAATNSFITTALYTIYFSE